jgi:hypothetical protein
MPVEFAFGKRWELEKSEFLFPPAAHQTPMLFAWVVVGGQH